MQLVDSPLGWDTDSANKQTSLLFDNDVNKLWKLALGIVVLDKGM